MPRRFRRKREATFFSRVFALVCLSLVLAALLTSLLYMTISRFVFSAVRESQLLPQAETLSAMFPRYLTGELDTEAAEELLTMSETLLDAQILVVDMQGAAHSLGELHESVSEAILSDEALLSAIRAGGRRTFTLRSREVRVDMLVAGVPVVAGGQVRASLFVIRPLVEVLAGARSLDSAMLLSMLLVLAVMTYPVFWATRHLVLPLRQMGDVARKMAAGDFSARADDVQRGEIGQLARAFNDMAQRLSRTMGDLILERNRLRMILAGLNEGVVAVNTLGNVTQHNPAAVKLFSKITLPAGPEATGLAPADARLAVLPDAGVWRDFDRVLLTGEALSRNVEVGESVVSLVIAPLTDERGNLAGALGMFRDETVSSRLEQTRRDYVANVSHEMRSPLTAIRGLVEPLRDGLVKEEADRQRYYAILLRETMRLSRLVDDLMQLSRLQSGQVSLEKRTMKLDRMLYDLAERYTAAATAAGREFALDIDPQTLPMAYANADRVEQVLVILLDNAIKYTHEGGHIRLDARVDARRVTLMVMDDGVGIDPKDQPHVFERFYKVDKAHSGLGSGLGLSIAKELMDAMGETIGVVSSPGGGSVFWFTVARAGG